MNSLSRKAIQNKTIRNKSTQNPGNVYLPNPNHLYFGTNVFTGKEQTIDRNNYYTVEYDGEHCELLKEGIDKVTNAEEINEIFLKHDTKCGKNIIVDVYSFTKHNIREENIYKIICSEFFIPLRV